MKTNGINIFQGEIAVKFYPSIKDELVDIFSAAAPGRVYALQSDLSEYVSVTYGDLTMTEVSCILRSIFDHEIELLAISNRVVFDQQARRPLIVDPETRLPYESEKSSQE